MDKISAMKERMKEKKRLASAQKEKKQKDDAVP